MTGSSLRLGVSAHVRPDTAVTVQLHPRDGRVVVTVGDDGGGPWIDLYLRRPALVALRDTLTAAVGDLDTAVGAATGTTSDGSASDGSRSTEHPGGFGSVRDTAA